MNRVRLLLLLLLLRGVEKRETVKEENSNTFSHRRDDCLILRNDRREKRIKHNKKEAYRGAAITGRPRRTNGPPRVVLMVIRKRGERGRESAKTPRLYRGRGIRARRRHS